MGPIVARLASDFEGRALVGQVNVREEADLTRAYGVTVTPTFVFFDAYGKEVFRMEAFLQPFHLASGLEYVASGTYLEQPSFQRYVQQRAARTREAGGRVELWRGP